MAAGNDRRADVVGQYRDEDGQRPFHGTIGFELWDDCVSYVWHLLGENGTFLGQVGRAVSLRIVPKDSDPFEFALAHAIEGLRRYRINRMKAYDVER